MRDQQLSRRTFLTRSARGAAALGIGGTLAGCSQDKVTTAQVEPSKPDYRLGLDTYGVHRTLTAKDPANRKDLFDLLDALDDIGLQGLQIDPSHFPKENTEATIDRMEVICKEKGYYIEFGMGGWDVARMTERIKLTSRFGGKALRTFLGHEGTTQKELADYCDWAVPAMQQIAPVCDAHKVDVAIENHGDFTSPQMKAFLDRVDHPRIGCCLDTGNSLFRKEDPMECARRLAPYTRSMHLKDWFMKHDENDHPVWTEAVIGQGEVPVLEILKLVAQHQSKLDIALENPVQAGDDEAETVKREWRHLKASAAASNEMLALL